MHTQNEVNILRQTTQNINHCAILLFSLYSTFSIIDFKFFVHKLSMTTWNTIDTHVQSINLSSVPVHTGNFLFDFIWLKNDIRQYVENCYYFDWRTKFWSRCKLLQRTYEFINFNQNWREQNSFRSLISMINNLCAMWLSSMVHCNKFYGSHEKWIIHPKSLCSKPTCRWSELI